MQDLSIRISTRNPAGETQVIDISTLPKAPEITLVSHPEGSFGAQHDSAANAVNRFTRVDANNLLLEPGCTTPHVAVIDHSTGLMWSIESLGDPDNEDDGITQEHCIERCKQLRLLGNDDWRLPTRAELAGLVDDTRHEPAIDTTLFPKVKPRWHWTSTPCAWSSASAWYVSFYGGLVNGYHRNDGGFALAVRRAGQ